MIINHLMKLNTKFKLCLVANSWFYNAMWSLFFFLAMKKDSVLTEYKTSVCHQSILAPHHYIIKRYPKASEKDLPQLSNLF